MDDIKKCNSTLLSMVKKNQTEDIIFKAKRANSRSKKALIRFNSIITSLKVYKQIVQAISNEEE